MKKHIISASIGLLSLSGCANSVAQFYTTANPLNNIPSGGKVTCATPQIIHTSNLKADLQKSMREGWMQIGYSAWNGPGEDIQEEAIAKAHEIQACLILIAEAQSGSETEEMPISGGMGFGPYYGGYPYYSYPAYAPYTVSLYNISVFFLTQMKVFSTGLYVAELDNKSRGIIGSNKGVQVTLVVNGSSAYDADVIPGDIITQIGADKLTDYASYADASQAYAGQNTVFIINRAGSILKKNIKIVDLY